MPARIEVTADLIERATKRDSRHCMVAEAIKEANPTYDRVIVDLQTIRWSNKRTKKRYVAFTPTNVAQALVDFDAGDAIEPFAFRLKTAQVTPMARPKKDDQGEPLQRPSGAVVYDETKGSKTIGSGGVVVGGSAPPRAPLGGSSASGTSKVKAPPPDASNIELSKAAYRQYGRRLLRR